MADFESIIRDYTNADGVIPSEAIGKLAKAISTSVGNEFVDKSRYKAKLEEIDELNGKLQTAEDSVTTAEKWKDKHDKIKKEFDDYKSSVTAKETLSTKEKAYREVLNEIGIPEKHHKLIVRATDFDGMELDEKGSIKDLAKFKKELSAEYADYVVKTEVKGADTINPPTNVTNGEPAFESRAKTLAAEYRSNLYGEIKKNNN